MKFKRPELAEQFGLLHHDVRDALRELDAWSAANAIPEVVVTHVLRTPEEQEAIYWPQLAKHGHVNEAEARVRARAKFSWHLVRCAADIRNNHYTPEQLTAVVQFLRRGRERGPWEILSHDVGRGDHVHVGRRDFAWRRQQEPDLTT